MRTGIIASSRVAAGLTSGFVSNADDAASASTYTFTSQAIGTPHSTRRVVVAVAGRDIASTPTSVTVGGVGLTQDILEANTPIAYIYSGIVTSGTNANVVITLPSSNSYCSIGVWALYGLSPVATAEMTTNSTTPVADLTTVAGDFCIAIVAYRATTTTAPGFTWTTATSRFNGPGDGAIRSRAGADYIATGTTTSMGGTIINPFSTTESALVAVAYR